MKHGITSANSGHRAEPELAVELAVAAEEFGFESLWTVEHVVVPGAMSSPYPYTDDGSMPGGPDLPIADPFVWLSFVAGATRTIKLGTALLVLPLHHPLRLAKAIATLDVVSSGRVVVGVGVGWLREEVELLDLPWADRGRRADEQIMALRALWSAGSTTFYGDYYRFDDVRSFPKPRQQGGPPIVVGGHSDAAARRAGRLADGFLPASSDPEVVGQLLGVMRRAAVEAGRSADEIEVTCTRVNNVDRALRLAELGVHRINMIPPVRPAELRERLEQYRDRIMQPLRDRGV